MFKVGVCGHFGKNLNLLNGQTIKTKILTKELQEFFGTDKVQTLDTHGWKKNPISLIINCINLISKCENVIILPANNGLKVLVPLFTFLNKIFCRKLHYVVIGGWLSELLKTNFKLKKKLKQFSGIYVETNKMIKSLQGIGLNNIYLLPNFKDLKILEEMDLIYNTKPPYKLCTFSRVMKEKGIEDAIKVVTKINMMYKKTIYTLDIYGPIEQEYNSKFLKLQKEFPVFIEYKGIVPYNYTTQILKDYFALLFPTHFYTEGIPGTIIDAYAAGVPVISSRWENFDDIIDDFETGIGFEFEDCNIFQKILIDNIDGKIDINSMKTNCLLKAKQYMPQKVILDFVKYL
jgi:glycosyltransferase involved in cell wall biosynthesis